MSFFEKMIYAQACRNGIIEFTEEPNEGAIAIVHGPAEKVRGIVDVGARHAHERGVLLVPGVPEAGGDDVAALCALIEWRDWMEECHPELDWRPDQ